MAGKSSHLSQEIKKYRRYKNELQELLRKTKHVLEGVYTHKVVNDDDSMEDEILSSLTLDRIEHLFNKHPAIVVLGQNSKVKAQFINVLLGKNILPSIEKNWRWIKFEYGVIDCVNLSSALKYEDVENMEEIAKSWTEIPEEELLVPKNDPSSLMVIDAKINHGILRELPIFVAPDKGALRTFVESSLNILPLFVYLFDNCPLNKENIKELNDLKKTYPYSPILFLSLPPNSKDSNTSMAEPVSLCSSKFENASINYSWMEHVQNCGFLNLNCISNCSELDASSDGQYINLTNLENANEIIDNILKCLIHNLRVYITAAVDNLNLIHTQQIQKIKSSELDISRERKVIPKRIKYALKMETELYRSLLDIFKDRDEELTEFIQNIIQHMLNNLVDTPDVWFLYSIIEFDADQEHECYFALKKAYLEVQERILSELRNKVACHVAAEVDALRELYSDALYTCMSKLDQINEDDNQPSATNALNEMFAAPFNIDIQNLSPSLIDSMVNSITNLFGIIFPPKVPKYKGSWQKKLKSEVLTALSPQGLVKSLCRQFEKKLTASHQTFQNILKSILNNLNTVFEQMENRRQNLYTLYAPKLANLSLQTVNLNNMIRFGLPHCTIEIDRGRFGLVRYSNGWGNSSGPCAVKSVLINNEKLWKECAMEFYNKSNVAHERIVKLHGFMIDYPGSSGNFRTGAIALFITEFMVKNLHTALRQNLPLLQRIKIAIDVMEGIKYLHSSKLIHSNITKYNVLLDNENRAKLNIGLDLKSESNLQMSIAETMLPSSMAKLPIHLAPEYSKNRYTKTIDIYAFGILFWFLCAGQSYYPNNYEKFDNKDEMFEGVLKGVRPEKLNNFTGDCWVLMVKCWSSDPLKRPQPNAILTKLELISDKIRLGHFRKELVISNEFQKYEKVCSLKVNRQRQTQTNSTEEDEDFINKIYFLYNRCQ